MSAKKQKLLKSNPYNQNTKVESVVLLVLLVILAAVLVHASIKYKRAHTYVRNPNPFAREQ